MFFSCFEYSLADMEMIASQVGFLALEEGITADIQNNKTDGNKLK